MAKKQNKSKETAQKKKTGDSETVDDGISIEEKEVELDKEEPEKKQEVSTKEEKVKKETRMFGDMIGETVKLLINQTYLKESENKISTEEIKETQFGESISRTIEHYFPMWNLDHPLFSLVASSGMLLVLLNQKMPTQYYDEGADVEGESQGISEGAADNKNLPSSNPYVNIKD